MAGEERILVAESTIETLLAASFPPDESSLLTDQIARLPDPSAALRALQSIRLAVSLGATDLPAVTRALSLLADVLVDRAVRMARVPLEARYGHPASLDDHGHLEEAAFSVIALGKLGGQELNYSSDI